MSLSNSANAIKDEPTTIWIVTDGKIGDLVQCRGVAKSLQKTWNNNSSVHVLERIVQPSKFWATFMPWGPIDPKDSPSRPDSPIRKSSDKWPDVVIGSGRRAVPYMRRIKKESPATLTVFLKDPRHNSRLIDLIWIPEHDKREGRNVFKTWTSPHHLDDTALLKARKSALERFGHHQPTIGLILGGDSGSVTYNSASSAAFGALLQQITKQSGWTEARILATASRRTPPALRKAVENNLSNTNAWIWDGHGENPYLEILSVSDCLIVTGDSHNMVSEALATGRPILVYRPKGLSAKLHTFLNAMEQQGAILPFSAEGIGKALSAKGHAINATDEIAAQITALATKRPSA